MNQIRRFYTSLSPLKRGALFYFGFWGAIGMFIPFINLYFRQDLGFSGQQIGLLFMCFPLMRLLIAIPVASIADRYCWRIPLLMITIAGFTMILPFATLPQSSRVWGIFMILFALFFGPTIPLADSIIASMANRHQLNFGSMRLWGSLSFALFTILFGGIWHWLGFQAMFILTAICFLPTVLFASGLEEGEQNITTETKNTPLFKILKHDGGLLVLIIASFFVGGSISMSVIFDGIYINSLGGTQTAVGVIFGISAFSELPTMQYRQAIVRRLSGPGTLLLGYGLIAAAFFGYTIARQPWVLIPMGIIKGLGFGLFFTSTIQLASERTPQEWSSTIQSIIAASAFGLAPLIASPLSGVIYDYFGPTRIYLCAGVLVSGASLMLFITMNRGVFTDIETNPPIIHQSFGACGKSS